MYFPWRRAQIPWREKQLPQGAIYFTWRKAQVPLRTIMFWIVFQSQPSHVCFYVDLRPNIRKFSKKNYNFIIGNISIKIHMRKLKSYKILDKFVPQGTWLASGSNYLPQGKTSLSCIRERPCPYGKNILSCFKKQPCPWGKKVLNYLGEQPCSLP